jgi:hypothetical protein
MNHLDEKGPLISFFSDAAMFYRQTNLEIKAYNIAILQIWTNKFHLKIVAAKIRTAVL